MRGQDGDRAQGVKILVGVTNDYTLPPLWRAVALYNIAQAISSNTVSFYTTNLSDPALAALLPKEGTDSQRLDAAYLALLKMSDDTYPTSFAEYAIAGNYYARLYNLNTFPASLKPNDAAVLMKKYVSEGDTRNDSSIYSSQMLLLGSLYRTFGIISSDKILGTLSLSVGEAEYNKVLAQADGLNPNPLQNNLNPALGAVLQVRFFYANFLLRYSSGKEADIRTLLIPFGSIDPTTASVGSTFTTIKNAPAKDFIKVQSLQLAKISPEYKKFLLKLGVTL
jgi:hypothetical protein